MPSIVVDAKLPPPRGQAAPAAAAAASVFKVAPTPSANIGSFRAAEDWEDVLPSNLRNLLGKILVMMSGKKKLCKLIHQLGKKL